MGAAFVLMLVGVVAGTGPPSSAIGSEPVPGGNCSSGGLKYAFTGQYWDPAGPVDHRNGGGGGYNAGPWIEAWEGIKNHNGSKMVNMTQSFGEIIVTIGPLATSGLASCSGKFVKINEDLILPPSGPNREMFRAVLQHEIGHTMGLNHSQKDPRHDGLIPVMATCLSPAELGLSAISQDDASAMEYKNGLAVDNFVPNPGFERGGYAFGAAGTVGLTFNGTPFTGSKAARWKGGFIQTIGNVTSTQLEKIRGEVWYKDHGAGVYGRITVEVWESWLTYQSNTTTCDWSSNDNESLFVTSYGWVLQTINSGWGKTHWKNLKTTEVTTLHKQAQVLLRIRNSDSGAGYINVDNPIVRYNR